MGMYIQIKMRLTGVNPVNPVNPISQSHYHPALEVAASLSSVSYDSKKSVGEKCWVYGTHMLHGAGIFTYKTGWFMG